MSTTELSRRLNALRTYLGLSQERAAKQLGIPRTTLSGWERGAREPDADSLKKLADLYHCTIDYILGYAEDGVDEELSPNQKVLFNKLRGCTDEEAKQVLDILAVVQRNRNPSDY